MRWLTLEYLKAHSRITNDCENEKIEQYGNAAEETILNYLNRSYENLIETYGGVPDPLWVAAALLVDNALEHGSPSSSVQMHNVPYNFDMYIKPYMIL